MILLRAVVYGIDVLYASVGFRHQALRFGKPLTGHAAVTVLIRQRAEKTFSVRMNMAIGIKVEDTPELYQQFFAALQRKLHYRAAV